jgi:CDP-diacylglycerol---glycerol-3-phosphate 3-phosphatidyltransferase
MLKQIPNILTFSRLILTVIVLAMILYSPRVVETEQPKFLDIAFVLFVISGLTDIFDGMAARKLKVASKFGRMLDPLVDKILVCGAFICFAIIGEPKLFTLNAETLAVIQWTIVGILVAREVYVTVLRHISEGRGISFGATYIGKIKMFLHSFAIGTVIVKMAHVREAAWGNWFTAVILVVVVASTIISGLVYHIRWKKYRLKQ